MTNETGIRAASDVLSDEAPLTDRINAEPSILRGLSLSEAWLAIGVSFGVWIPVSLLIGLLMQHLPAAVIFMGAGPIFTVWALSGWLAQTKRNRPDYFYQHKFKRWMAAKGWWPSRFVHTNGAWDIGRSLPAVSARRARQAARRSRVEAATGLKEEHA